MEKNEALYSELGGGDDLTAGLMRYSPVGIEGVLLIIYVAYKCLTGW